MSSSGPSGSQATSQSDPSQASSSQLAPMDSSEVDQQFNAYEDPKSLLRVIPLANYAPTARVVSHMASHTTAYPSPSLSPNPYPQYAAAFQQINQPVSQQDWALRQQAEGRIADLLRANGPGYASGYPSPASLPSCNSSAIDRSQSSLPYAFLPAYMPSPSPAHPPNPTSIPGHSPSAALNPEEYFNQRVDEILKRNQQPPEPSPPTIDPRNLRESSSASASTPTISRAVSRMALGAAFESPDPLAMSRPSPGKRRKSAHPEPSPTLGHATLPNVKQTRMPFSTDKGSTVPKASSSRAPIPSQWQPSSPVKAKQRLSVEITLSPHAKGRYDNTEVADDDDDESLDWGDEPDRDADWVMGGEKAFRSPSPGGFGAERTASRSARTGERDMRTAQQKFTTLLEDIFEAHDSLPADPDDQALSSSRFFDALTRNESTPLLSSDTIGKITRYVSRLNSTRRHTAKSGPQDHAVWDEEALKRVFRLLERCMMEVENVDAFPEDKKSGVAKGKKGSKGKGGKRKKGIGSPDLPQSQDADAIDGSAEQEVLDEDAILRHEAVLESIQRASLAAECCLTILDSEGLSKPMYSEDLIALCTTLLRLQMTKVIFPVIEAMAGEKILSRFLSSVVDAEISARKTKQKLGSSFQHSTIASIAQSTAAALPRLSSLISRDDMSLSDSLVIQTVYLAIAPLFVTEPASRKGAGKEKGTPSKGGFGVMKVLRMEALGCLRGAFAKYNQQRQWILEEILSSLIKLPSQKTQSKFQSTSGSSMSTISALLLQLLQASAHGVIPQIQKLRITAAEVEMGGKKGAKEEAANETKRLCDEVIDASYRSARVIAGYLISKSTSTKVSKTTSDTDYRAILDQLVADVLSNLYRPEWPAASVFLNVFSRLMITSVEEVGSSAENTAAKNIALDHLGDIAAKLKAVQASAVVIDVKSLDQIIASPDDASLAGLVEAHQTVHSFLSASAREDGMYSSANDLQLTQWALELHTARSKVASLVAKLAAEKDEEAVATRGELAQLGEALDARYNDVWAQDEDVFGSSQTGLKDTAGTASIGIAQHRSLQSAFDPILRTLLSGMSLQAVALRSKALRGLSVIIQVDSTVLSQGNVRQAIEERLSDPSPAVRDSAVDLVGKFIVQKPELAVEYYPHIALRISDTGLAVRKKVIKLLREIFSNSRSHSTQVDICCNMMQLVGDTDDNVKELATKALAEMMYTETGSGNLRSLDSAAILVGVIGRFSGSAKELSDALLEVAKLDAAAGKTQRSAQMVDALIQRLIDATEQSDFDSISHVKAISLMTESNSDLIDPKKTAVLLNYLKPPINSDEQASNELLLRIFRLSIPSLPKTASSFSSELTAKLLPMIAKPSGGLNSMVETVGCFCAVVKHLTKDYAKLLQVLRACESKLRGIRAQYEKTNQMNQPPMAVGTMLYITALIAHYCNLDEVAQEDEIVRAELRKISVKPLYEHLYSLYLDFARMTFPQYAPTSSLGCIFRTYPSLILRDETSTWMQTVYVSNDYENKARLFTVIYEFLESEAKRKAAGGGQTKDMEALIGSASELSESGVSTAIVQRNIQHILDGARSHHPGMQNAAMNVLTFTVNQGLYHPLQCMPILISLETHDDPAVSIRALELHTTLHRKHSALVNVRFIDFAKASYEYQRTITSEVSGHRDGNALLAGWFGLVGEKRAWRLDFLRALGKAFDYDTSTSNAFDVGFLLYIAENLATFEYKQQEEVMIVIQQLSAVVSTCTPLVATVEKATLSAGPESRLEGLKAMVGAGSQEAADTVSAEGLINSTLIVSLALLTKNHLLDLYTLTEDKCLKQATVKKSSLGERAAVRKGSHILHLSRIPLIRGVETVKEFNEQQATFLLLLQEDGALDMDM